MKHKKSRRSAVAIMGQLIGLVKPLIGIMVMAVVMGVLGYLCAIFITIFSVKELLSYIAHQGINRLPYYLLLLAVMRGLLHYGEQYCNHYIAFKILALIRHQVFAALKKLCPAKLAGKDKGNLISVITSDIELLEVFYAHTISPIAIAFLTSLIMIWYMGSFHVMAGVFALCAYAIVGVLLPLRNGSRGALTGMEFRNGFGELNSLVLDSLRGLDETIQYGQGNVRSAQMDSRSKNMGKLQKKMADLEAKQRSFTNFFVLCCSIGMFFLMLGLQEKGIVSYESVLLCTAAMMSSFGPVIALSNLSNTLNQTLASGERILNILEEQPVVQEITREENIKFHGVECEKVGFSYGEEKILEDVSFTFEQGKIIGILGESGCGKSTLLKLLMRFYDVEEGKITISKRDIRNINTKNLRDMEVYMTQETALFHDSIANNITLGRSGYTKEQIMEAAKKAAIHEFIMSLPKGYDTPVGELGSTLSGGEKQRIGIARMFLSDAKLWLLDEPTSNLDSLNEGIILKSIKEAAKDKTVIIVSHRKSTLKIADMVYEMTAK